MLSADLIAKDSRFPGFIRGHRFFNNPKNKIKKVFPLIGLNNFEQEVKINLTNYYEETVNAVLEVVLIDINKIIINSKSASFSDLFVFLSDFKSSLKNTASYINYLDNGCITLNCPKSFNYFNKVFLNKGMSLFKALVKIDNLLSELSHPLRLIQFDQTRQFQAFNDFNYPKINTKIVFSSDGIVGAWDIATMSMRGIKSCQTWGKIQAMGLVGSIIDPYVAIIYLTNGTEVDGLGSNMLRRCLVRLVVNPQTSQFEIMIEKMYANFDKPICELFEKIIKEKTKNKYKVFFYDRNITDPNHYPRHSQISQYFIPLAAKVKSLHNTERSYLDSKIGYRTLGTAAKSTKKDILKYFSLFYKSTDSFSYGALVTTDDHSSSYNRSNPPEIQFLKSSKVVPLIDKEIKKLFLQKRDVSFFKEMILSPEKHPGIFLKDSQSEIIKFLTAKVKRKKIFTSLTDIIVKVTKQNINGLMSDEVAFTKMIKNIESKYLIYFYQNVANAVVMFDQKSRYQLKEPARKLLSKLNHQKK